MTYDAMAIGWISFQNFHIFTLLLPPIKTDEKD